MEISKCVGGSSGKEHNFTLYLIRKVTGFLSIKDIPYFMWTDKEDYLVDLFLGNTWSCKSANKDIENESLFLTCSNLLTHKSNLLRRKGSIGFFYFSLAREG